MPIGLIAEQFRIGKNSRRQRLLQWARIETGIPAVLPGV